MHVWLIMANNSVEKAFIGPQDKAEELLGTLQDAHYASYTRAYGWMDFSAYCEKFYWRIRMVEAYSG